MCESPSLRPALNPYQACFDRIEKLKTLLNQTQSTPSKPVKQYSEEINPPLLQNLSKVLGGAERCERRRRAVARVIILMATVNAVITVK